MTSRMSIPFLVPSLPPLLPLQSPIHPFGLVVGSRRSSRHTRPSKRLTDLKTAKSSGSGTGKLKERWCRESRLLLDRKRYKSQKPHFSVRLSIITVLDKPNFSIDPSRANHFKVYKARCEKLVIEVKGRAIRRAPGEQGLQGSVWRSNAVEPQAKRLETECEVQVQGSAKA
ncbi:hypothetical protein B0H17DRAFT_1138673 [Mycena rosella]|uniref:Uncharacterized protein n=1 Tax=Mycena rosella TaxID=1033263 RepID=A0AAD7D7B4_MYCRO|nr:hypothetical protein B0H17DRAFT_1138673 [Mycena rosella]